MKPDTSGRICAQKFCKLNINLFPNSIDKSVAILDKQGYLLTEDRDTTELYRHILND